MSCRSHGGNWTRWLWSADRLPARSRRAAGGSPQQGFCSLEPTLRDVTLRPNPGGLLERTAEVIRAQTGDVGEHGEREVFIEMRLDAVAHTLQALRREALAGASERCPTKR